MNRIMLIALATLVLAGCAKENAPVSPLDPSGSVRFWTVRPTDKLKEVAAATSGLEFSEGPKDRPWFHLLNAEVADLDLIFTETGRDLVKAASEGTVADLGPSWGRLTSAKALWPAFSKPAKAYLLPSTVYLWGLFYNKEALDANGVKFPTGFGGLEGAFSALSAKGVVPVALGAKEDWSVFAWLEYLDIRKNGAEAHQKLLDGSRSFGDKSLAPVYATLQKWRDSGWIDRKAGAKTWSDALKDVQDGAAAFSLMGAFAANRFVEPAKIRWAPVPKGGAKTGEIGVIQGFAVAAKAADLDAALALADTYVARSSPDLVNDDFSLPSVSTQYNVEKGVEDVLSTIKAAQANVLKGEKSILPQLDRYLPAQAAYDVLKALQGFFAEGSTMSATDLSAALVAARN